MVDKKEKAKYDKEYYEKNKEKLQKYRREYTINNKEKIDNYQKEYSLKNKEKRRLYKLKYYSIKKNRKNKAKNDKLYGKLNRKELNEYHKKYEKERRKKDMNFKIRGRIRCRIRSALRSYGLGKNLPANEYGINYSKIINHLKPFPKPVSNFHIDHIKPLCQFNLTDPDQIKIAFAPENHQWLTPLQNMRKPFK